ncbi:MAG: cell division topological specificity factor MinE [Bacillota bacterium]|jgi:cell division topological specificity factor
MFDLRRLLLGKGSRGQAKERLQLILVHDRSSLAPEMLEELKRRIMEVIEEFVEIDESGLMIDLEQSDEAAALITNIPIKAVKRGLGAR